LPCIITPNQISVNNTVQQKYVREQKIAAFGKLANKPTFAEILESVLKKTGIEIILQKDKLSLAKSI
jgi:hypothetical protein